MSIILLYKSKYENKRYFLFPNNEGRNELNKLKTIGARFLHEKRSKISFSLAAIFFLSSPSLLVCLLWLWLASRRGARLPARIACRGVMSGRLRPKFGLEHFLGIPEIKEIYSHGFLRLYVLNIVCQGLAERRAITCLSLISTSKR